MWPVLFSDATPNTVSVEEFLSNGIDSVVSVFTPSYVTVTYSDEVLIPDIVAKF